jgi:hypothetical protein
MAKMTHVRDVAGVVAFEKICNSVQKSCNAGGRGFLQREQRNDVASDVTSSFADQADVPTNIRIFGPQNDFPSTFSENAGAEEISAA